MVSLLIAAALTAAPTQAHEAFLRRRVAEVALEQLRAADPRWEPSQRDCAGLVRFAYRSAYRQFDAERKTPLFRDEQGKSVEFADARTLISGTFASLGRGDAARKRLRSGDLLAFRVETASGEPEYHLMIAILPPDGALSGALVVYHPGQPGAQVRSGTLRALEQDAPLEWRPIEANGGFLGFYRFKEWGHE
jgi:uncharacterized protein YfaT (DUF1175 family)